MKPLHVTARLGGPIVLPHRPLALDALLAAAVAVRDGITPAYTAEELVPIEIPIEREPGGRFHLASFASYEVETRETRFINRRPVIEQAQWLGDPKRKRMQISAGPDKGYRIPMEALYLAGDRLDWWCVGDDAEIRELLSLVLCVGKKRSVGLGRVRQWLVEPCEPWGDGFPLVSPDGYPMRNLPIDWPGVREDSPRALAVISYPYWLKEREEPCLVPPLR